ncbi:MAG: TrmH family RNA methyltransferase [Candidatus Saccharimonadota bacterium]
MPEIIVIAHNIRSTHNVGALFRTAEGFGVSKLLLTGYTPYPVIASDPRLPHIANKLTSQIHKTALGAEEIVPFEHRETLDLETLKEQGYRIIALEQAEASIPMQTYKSPKKVALLLGEEVAGIAPEHLEACDDIVEIPMVGTKESFNVSVAAGIALYQLALG